MKQTSDLTDKMIAYQEVPDFNTDDCVDWAIDMVGLGFDTPHLLILAACDKPTHYFTTIEYLKSALSELDITVETGNEARLSYCKYLIRKIARGELVKNNIKLLSQYSQHARYDLDISDFHLLYWAWDDLDNGQQQQEYWPGATLSNIEGIVIMHARHWLDSHVR